MPEDRFDKVAQAIAELKNVIQGKKKTGHESDLNDDAIEAKIKEVIASKGIGRKGEFSVDADESPVIIPAGGIHPMELVEQAKNINEMSDFLYLAGALLRRPVRSLKLFGAAKTRFKAMDAGTATEGAEWIPTGFSSDLINKLALARKVAALFRRFPMPTDPYKLPVEGGDATAYLASEATSDTATKFTASTPGTANVEFDAAKLAVRVLVSKDIEEDSVIAVVPYIRDKVVKALVDGEEEAILSGDDSTTHQDSDIHALGAADRRKAWKGLRKHALALGTAKVDISTFSTANLRAIRTAMGKYGVNPADLAWIMGVKGYNKTLSLTEVLTVDKYGDKATLLNGELGKLDGIPIVVSEFSRENLNAAGVYDGVTTDNGEIELVYRPGFMIGDRRNITVKVLTELYAETDQDAIIATMREDFEDVLDATAEKLVGLGYNLDCA